MEKLKFTLFSFFCFFLSSSISFADVNQNDNSVSLSTDWSYHGMNGPEKWGSLDPSFKQCASGKQQSPIDIPNKTQNKNMSLLIHYQKAPLSIVDNGTTQLNIANTQTIFNDGHSVQLNFNDDQEFITLNDKNFRLVQLHFHTPSENKLQGKSFPLEVHFVHQGKGGTLAVIGVFFKKGNSNDALETILDNLPKEVGKVLTIEGKEINPIAFIPSKQNYYEFAGSLTTPPCAENVAWIVMKDPIEASQSQINQLIKALHGFNARPIQALNGREINSSLQNN